MTERADIVVIGAGLLGLAAARALIALGREPLVLERATVGHPGAGSQGVSRIFRLGYPDPLYARMAAMAGEGWRVLEAEADEPLLVPTPQVSFGRDLDSLHAALRAAGSQAERWARDDVTARFPHLRAPGDAVFEPDSGVLLADRCLAALRPPGVREHVAVTGIDDDGRHVTVATDAGAIEANVVVACPGAWSSRFFQGFAATRETIAYAAPPDDGVLAGMPIFIDHDEPACYGLPTTTVGRYKIALHHAGPTVDPDDTDAYEASANAVAHAAALVQRWLPDFSTNDLVIETCPYDNTPDEDFVLDRVGNVVIGAGTSGHGFKFGPLLGEILACLAVGREPPVDLARFASRRPSLGSLGAAGNSTP